LSRIQVDHHLPDGPAGRAGEPGCSAPVDSAHGVADAGEDPSIVEVDATLAGPCRPCWSASACTSLIATAPWAISEGHIDQHPTRVVPGAAFTQPVRGLAKRRRQTDPVGKLGQKHRPGMRHPACAVRG